MRLSFRKKEALRWVDSDELGWTPEEPLDFAPPNAANAPNWIDAGGLGWTPEEPLEAAPRRAANAQAPQRPVSRAATPRPVIITPPPVREASPRPTPHPEASPQPAAWSQPVAWPQPESEPETPPAPKPGWPQLSWPEISWPDVKLPKLELPKPKLPTLPSLPSLTLPTLPPLPSLPPFPSLPPLPKMRVPSVRLPKVPLPRLRLPAFLFAPLPATLIPANSNRAPRLLLFRMSIGVAQGLLLYGLMQARGLALWPANDAFLFNGLLLAAIFAPLVMLEGLGEIALPLLALWSGTIAFSVATLGLYQAWRNPALPHAEIWALVCISTMLVIAQTLLHAGLRDKRAMAGYHVYFAATWTLAARLLVWVALAGTAFALIGSGNSLFNWLRADYPTLPLPASPELVIWPLLGLVSAFAFAIARSGGWLQRQITTVLLVCFTVALPFLILASLAAMALHFSPSALPLPCLLVLGGLLVISTNASYRGEEYRNRGRKGCEAAAAFVILALAAVTAMSLYLRVDEWGWTTNRVLAAGVIGALGLYGVGYGCTILVSLGGAPWMKGTEHVNLAMALLILLTCLALSTPLADPLQLSVKAQTARLAAMDPDLFDFTWLNRDGARFGHDALETLAHGDASHIAGDASLALSVAPIGDTPPPTEIGANIAMHPAGAHVPASLLNQNWAGFHVPPCLNKPAQSCDGWLLDMDGDGHPEVLLVYGNDARWWASVMKQDWRGAWSAAAALTSPPCHGSLTAMRAGRVALAQAHWRDLIVAGMRLTPAPSAGAELPCPR